MTPDALYASRTWKLTLLSCLQRHDSRQHSSAPRQGAPLAASASNSGGGVGSAASSSTDVANALGSALEDDPEMRARLDGMLGSLGMGGGLNDVMNNPALMGMAESIMRDPAALQVRTRCLPGDVAPFPVTRL